MVAYLDLLIIENLCINYLILYTSGKLLNRAIKKLKLASASAVGALYVFSLYVNIPMYLLNISKVIMAILLVKIAFNSKNVKMVINETIVFFMVSFIYAGCALGFLHLIKPKVIYMVNGIIIGGEYIFEILMISILVSFILIKFGMKLIKMKHKFNKNDMLCNLKIGLGKNCINVNALIDTGNLLTDPISGMPVIIVEKEKLRALIPDNEIDRIDELIGGDGIFNEEFCNTRIRAIPYISLGNKNGVMIAYKTDWIKVEYRGEINEINNALIGIYNDTLTKNNKYSALIGLQILERSKVKNEFNTDIENESKYSIC